MSLDHGASPSQGRSTDRKMSDYTQHDVLPFPAPGTPNMGSLTFDANMDALLETNFLPTPAITNHPSLDLADACSASNLPLEVSDHFLLQSPPPTRRDVVNNVIGTPSEPTLSSDPTSTIVAAADCHCATLNQKHNLRLEKAVKGPSSGFRLDEVLQLIRDASAHATSYLTCATCAPGCMRLMNIALLLQTLVNLLCQICKDPTAYLASPNNVRLTIGAFQLSENEDLCHKRLLIGSAAKGVTRLVTSFDDVLRGIQDAYISTQGHDGLPESVRLNLTWLLDVVRNLKTRVTVIVELIDRDEWGHKP